MKRKIILASLAGILPFTIALSSCKSNSNNDNSEPDKPNDKSKTYDSTKHRNELISLFDFNVDDYASNNFDKIKPLKNDEFNLTSIKISEIDDLKGFISLNIDGLYKNNQFSTTVKIDGFRTPKINDKLSDDLNIKISNIKLIEEKKTIDDLLKLESKPLFDYFTELKGFTKDRTPIDVLNLLKETGYPSYSAPIFKIYKKDSDYFLKLQIKLIYKHYINNKFENKEVIVFENLKKALPNDYSYTKADVLSYLLQNKVKFIKDIKEARKDFSYASEYRYFYEKIKTNLDPSFVKFEKENDYKTQYNFSTFSYKIQSVGYDDLNGQLHLQVAMVGHDKIGNETVSKPQEITISGFKKLSQEYFFKNFFIAEKNPKDPKWDKVKKELADLYNKSANKEKFETTDRKYFHSLNGYWNIIRPAENGHIIEDNKFWNMIFLGTGQNIIENGYDKAKELIVDSNNNKFALSAIHVEFTKINNFQKRNNKLTCDYHFRITFAVKNSPDSYRRIDKNISIDKTITLTLN